MTATKSPAANPPRNPLTWVTGVAQRAAQALSPTRAPSVAEVKDVKFSSIAETSGPAGRMLRLEGLVFHSALAVRSIDQLRRGEAVVVEVKLTSALRGRSGSFAAEVALSPEVREVLFGRERTPIWRDAERP